VRMWPLTNACWLGNGGCGPRQLNHNAAASKASKTSSNDKLFITKRISASPYADLTSIN